MKLKVKYQPAAIEAIQFYENIMKMLTIKIWLLCSLLT